MSYIGNRNRILILLAEDDVVVRNLIRSVLQRNAYDVLAASDGVEAVKLSQAHRGTIDLFLTDVEMPAMDGITAYREIHKQRPDTQVLFMSGGGAQSELPESCLLLAKPFQMSDLLGSIRELLGTRPPLPFQRFAPFMVSGS